MKSKLMLVCVLAFCGIVAATELIVNGDFEQPLDVGWIDTVVGTSGSFLIERTDTLGQPSPGYSARTYKYLWCYTSLSQTVDVPNVNLNFSLYGRLRIGGGSSTCWPVAAIILRYLNSAGVELGNSKMYIHTEYSTWANSDTAHLIEINTPETWETYGLDVAQEIASNLPGVNPSEVGKVTIELYSYDNGT
jgi:hypothetical protein